MKKTLYIIAIIALMAGLCQCRKPVMPIYGDGEIQTVTFVANCSGNSKGEFTPDLDLGKIRYKWDKDNDKMYVYASDDGSFGEGHGAYCGCLSIQSLSSDEYTAIFSGGVVMPYNTGKVRFIHYGSSVTVDSNTGVASVSFAEQYGTLDAISSKVVTACKMDYNSSGSYTPTAENKFLVQFALINLSFSNFNRNDVISRGFENNGIEVTAEGMINYTKGSSSVLRNAATTVGSYYTVFMPDEREVIHSFLGDAEEASMNPRKFDLGTFYHGSSFSEPCVIPGTKIIPDDAIGGKFTVDNNKGTKVYFAKGNVQYRASTNTWRFAPHQYEYKGSANSNISPSYDGWIDLFGWATSGKMSGDNFQHSQPYTCTKSNNDYKAYGSLSYNLNYSDGTADWGKNFADGWFTPTKVQYNYIINTRSTRFVKADGTVVSNFRYSVVQVTVSGSNIVGVLLFPDDFHWTTGMGNEPKFNNATISQTYTTSQFELIEKAGAVFIPCSGYREETGITEINKIGDYWTSTRSSDRNCFFFQVCVKSDAQSVSASKDHDRYAGFAVRLIREVTTPSGNNVGGEAEGLDLKPWDNP